MRFGVAIGIIGLLAITLGLYWPGLHGPFLFDDKPNLSVMNNYGGLTSWDNLLRFLLEAPGSSGRPISLLTFAVNDQAWPLDIFSVKFTNLAIHLLVCLVLFLFIREVFRKVGKPETYSNLSSLVIVSIFAVHPLNVSTVLYAVQRMTELSALFVLIGALVFLKLFPDHQIGKAGRLRLWCAGLGLAFFAMVGILCKENAFLLFPLSWVCIFSLGIQYRGNLLHWRIWSIVFWISPILLFFIYYFVKSSATFDAAWLRREFTLGERLYTELNIVTDYIFKIITPSSVGGGLYHEDYPVSTGFLSPVKTLFSFILHISLVVLSVGFRRKFPLFCFGVLWFYIGHSLESSFIPLELYFEHRNYLPMIGLLVAVYSMADYLVSKLRPKLQWLTAGLSVLVIVVACLIVTYQRVIIWGNEELLIRMWAEENPTSSRSQMQLISFEASGGDLSAAYEVALGASENIPGDLSFKLAKIFIKCEANEKVDRQLVDDVIKAAPTSMYENSSYNMLRALIELVQGEGCEGINLSDLLLMYQALGENPKFLAGDIYASNYYYFIGDLYAAMGNLDGAISSLDQAYELDQNITFPLKQATWLASAGLIDEAERYLDIAERSDSRTKYLNLSSDVQLKAAKEKVEKYRDAWETFNNSDARN